MSHEKYQSCMHACIGCVVACERCASECLHEEDVKMMARCIELDRDCADVCALAMRLMSRGSQFAARICALCAEVCDACASECEKHDAEHCNGAPQRAGSAPRNAEKWRAKTKRVLPCSRGSAQTSGTNES